MGRVSEGRREISEYGQSARRKEVQRGRVWKEGVVMYSSACVCVREVGRESDGSGCVKLEGDRKAIYKGQGAPVR